MVFKRQACCCPNHEAWCGSKPSDVEQRSLRKANRVEKVFLELDDKGKKGWSRSICTYCRQRVDLELGNKRMKTSHEDIEETSALGQILPSSVDAIRLMKASTKLRDIELKDIERCIEVEDTAFGEAKIFFLKIVKYKYQQ
ncbi:uncharacterized protein LOC125559146 isoform X2 [Nematostella vectensis]|uniref:uncharacterized protein LOC125559146 isoform X2 n=1 Tax=Nematostella vectensis TaxID=45351 RepID=UPI002077563F|nr:uncharacterized protein LOC125559146 isoform X2 [Nematostella vectensis]